MEWMPTIVFGARAHRYRSEAADVATVIMFLNEMVKSPLLKNEVSERDLVAVSIK